MAHDISWSERKGPCGGLIVVDMSSLISGPLCGRFLAELGATVIKVETEFSDASRSAPPLHAGHSAYYEQINYGKKGLFADPKTPDGLKLITDLCRQADVFIQNSRPKVMERLGLGYETLRVLNPSLIYVSITGFGESGALSDMPAYDNAIQGVVGFMHVQGSPEAPQAIRGPVADKIAAMSAANAALAALLERERNGGDGQKVEVKMISAYASFALLEELKNETFQSANVPPYDSLVDLFRTLETADGQVIGLLVKRQQFADFCAVIGREDLLSDDRFADTHVMIRNMGLLYDAVADDVRRFTTTDLIARMRECDVPFSPVLSATEFLESDYARETDCVRDFEDPELGTIRHLSSPATFSRWGPLGHRRAPKLGEHNDEIVAMIRSDKP